jgi:surfeit locus 1 family protein
VALALLGLLALLGIVGLVALGSWQVERRAWKLDLIARVDTRIHAAPASLPPRAGWPRVTAAADEYRRVQATGAFLYGQEALTQATTSLGAGFWVMTPLRMREGTLLVNRGFVPADRRDRASRAAAELPGEVTVTGLLRMTEPKGGFLRSNDPAADRWHSRDVEAIAAARGLTDVAPFFLDADATPNPGGLPVGGLTMVSFPNSHLVYALTWYALALMLAGATAYLAQEEWRARRRRG